MSGVGRGVTGAVRVAGGGSVPCVGGSVARLCGVGRGGLGLGLSAGKDSRFLSCARNDAQRLAPHTRLDSDSGVGMTGEQKSARRTGVRRIV